MSSRIQAWQLCTLHNARGRERPGMLPAMPSGHNPVTLLSKQGLSLETPLLLLCFLTYFNALFSLIVLINKLKLCLKLTGTSAGMPGRRWEGNIRIYI